MELINILKSDEWLFPYMYTTSCRDLLNKKYKIYLDILENYKISDNRLNLIKSVCKQIIEALNEYLRGNTIESYLIVYSLLDNINESLIYISEYYSKYQFKNYYRARIIAKNKNIEKKDMFHIPFELRYLVPNNRYSISGIPSLYLGATPYTCWEELKKPKEEETWFVKIELPKNYRFLTLGLHPWELKDRYFKNKDITDDILISYLTMFPFVIACSAKKIYSSNSVLFKEEYIIPQIISSWVVKKDNFDGIIYTSTSTESYSKKNCRLYQNLFIPVKESRDTGFCPVLKSQIKLSNPICLPDIKFLEEHQVQWPPKYGQSNGRIRINSNSEIHYSTSGFAKIEEALSNYECTSLT